MSENPKQNLTWRAENRFNKEIIAYRRTQSKLPEHFTGLFHRVAGLTLHCPGYHDVELANDAQQFMTVEPGGELLLRIGFDSAGFR